MTSAPIESVAIIGAGTMGRGIAQVCAQAGFKVLLYDIDPQLAEAAIHSIEKDLSALFEKGKIDKAQQEVALNLISRVKDLTEVKADLIIEAATENLEVKRKIFSALEKINRAHCILTSNTSSIPITRIGTALDNKRRFAGLHFFNPAPVMKLVEIVKGAGTSDETIEALREFTIKLSKQPVLTQDSPGFIVNRVARHYYVESLKTVEDNVADVKTVDALLKASGFRMGPFELMDLIGIDVNLAVTKSVYEGFHQDSKFRPNRLQQQKVDAGELGRKTGKGFYDYK